jgi:hypothetical protein
MIRGRQIRVAFFSAFSSIRYQANKDIKFLGEIYRYLAKEAKKPIDARYWAIAWIYLTKKEMLP